VTPPGRRDHKAEQQEVLELEIGKARGTGIHPATRSCLRLLQHVTDLGPPESALDSGTGSGILALAAARFGIRQTLALDVDPHSVGVARLMRCLAPEGWLILGGIWWTRRNEFLASLVPHLQLVREDREAWWGAFLLRKN
jgi:ribosomal protein L11 methylase PrmA